MRAVVDIWYDLKYDDDTVDTYADLDQALRHIRTYNVEDLDYIKLFRVEQIPLTFNFTVEVN